MNPGDLRTKHARTWQAATHHPFLEGVRNGTLAPDIFATWLVQDYHFVLNEITCLAHLLARAPRSAQNILVQGLAALEAEATWFEHHAHQRGISLTAPLAPATAAYKDFFIHTDQLPFSVAMTGIWTVERAYLDAWMGVAPGHERYRAYVEHWANTEFEDFVSHFEQVVAALPGEPENEELAEQVFLQVARLEQDFWNMAWSAGKAD